MADEPKPDDSSFDPKGKSLTQRVDAFIADVKANYSIIITKDDGRTAEWQQEHHVAHMFLFNKYQSTVPANVETGGRTISWAHFSDPAVVWEKTDWADFLRTKANDVPKKNGTGWLKDCEPDKDATRKNVKAILVSDGIGSNGEAMAASGLAPCGEPCKCGAGRSNHLSDQAADLNSTALTQLTQALSKLDKDNAIDLDGYLKRFGLHRPLLN